MKSAANRLGKRAQAPADELSREVDGLKSSLRELQSDVVELVSHTFGLGRGGAHAARDTAASAVNQLRNRLTHLKDRGTEELESVEKRFEDHPIYAAAIAFGLGFLVAIFITRK